MSTLKCQFSNLLNLRKRISISHAISIIDRSNDIFMFKLAQSHKTETELKTSKHYTRHNVCFCQAHVPFLGISCLFNESVYFRSDKDFLQNSDLLDWSRETT